MDHYDAAINGFLESVTAAGDVYRSAVMRYVVHKVGDRHVLLKAIVNLDAAERRVPFPPGYDTDVLKIGTVSLFDQYESVAAFVADLQQRRVVLPFGEVEFPIHEGGRAWPNFNPFHPSAIPNQRLASLYITGDQTLTYRPGPGFDWDLKAAAEPYDSLDELLSIHGVGQLGQAVSVEIYAGALAWVNFERKDEAGRAVPSVVIAEGQDREKVTLGYKVSDGQTVIRRGRFSGGDLDWTLYQGFDHGVPKVFERQANTYIHAIAAYGGGAQQFGWLSESGISHNIRRRSFEAMDPDLTQVSAIVSQTTKRAVEARDLEMAAGALFYMLGFSVLRMGDVPKLQDAADLLLCAPNGNIMVVECTITLLKHDKVSKLHDRTMDVRRLIGASGYHAVKVLPVLVTCEPREDLVVDRTLVDKHGMLVLAREDLMQWLSQTHSAHDPNQVFEQFWQLAETARLNSLTPSFPPFPPTQV